MAGNALDRIKAKTNIEKAEEGLAKVCNKLATVSVNVESLNRSYPGKNSTSLVSKVYIAYQGLIRECMESFGGASKHIFIDYHTGLLGLVNQGADGDEVKVDITAHAQPIQGIIYDGNKPGIKDYAVTKTKVENLQVSVDQFVAATDDIIAAYQSLWWLGDDAGNKAVKDEAHNAAEKVRELIENYATKFKDINEQFKNSIIENEAQQKLSTDILETRANELYKILGGIDFNTISMNQDALDLIAKSWRNYI